MQLNRSLYSLIHLALDFEITPTGASLPVGNLTWPHGHAEKYNQYMYSVKKMIISRWWSIFLIFLFEHILQYRRVNVYLVLFITCYFFIHLYLSAVYFNKRYFSVTERESEWEKNIFSKILKIEIPPFGDGWIGFSAEKKHRSERHSSPTSKEKPK